MRLSAPQPSGVAFADRRLGVGKRVRGASRPLLVVVGTAALAIASLAAVPAARATGTTQRSAAGLSTNYDFARLVLQHGGWPASANNIAVLTQWLRAEEPTSRWWNRDNPLNNGLGSGGGRGLGSYRSVVAASFYVAQNLESPLYGYPMVARDLAASAQPGSTSRAIWRSDWASGHYGFGADWDTSPVPSVVAPPSVWSDPESCPTTYPSGEVGPCGRGFSTSGTSWRSGSPGGMAGDELWAVSTKARSSGTATWRPRVPPGDYEVSAYVPAAFADAVIAYVVHDAMGGHRVLLDQEPFQNVWVGIGVYRSTAAAPLVVSLGTSSPSGGGTYVAADALRFTAVARSRALGVPRPTRLLHVVARRPGRPQDVTALAGDGSTVVSWLAPSKDGGLPVASYTATAMQGGRSCRVVAKDVGEPSCTVRGLTDGRAYVFVVRATSRAGMGSESAPSSVVQPVHVTVVALTSQPAPTVGRRVRDRAVIVPTPTAGVVLFAVDGRVVPGCQSARVGRGHAACAEILSRAGSHEVLATYSGSAASAGALTASSLLVARAVTALRAMPAPSAAAALGVVTLRGWGLPGAATGLLVFATGSDRLCVAGVRGGGGTCSFRLRLAVGLHVVVAAYLGNHDFRGATARTTILVLPTPPS